jgi:hypothetical protein
VDARTESHLRTARRNQEIARVLLRGVVDPSIQPPPFEWAAVLGFYAAVHYVNAYLWEKLRYEPRDHDDRARQVCRVSGLRSLDGAYGRLRGRAFLARYKPEFRLSAAEAQTLLDVDLAQIEQTILSALGGTAPSQT